VGRFGDITDTPEIWKLDQAKTIHLQQTEPAEFSGIIPTMASSILGAKLQSCTSQNRKKTGDVSLLQLASGLGCLDFDQSFAGMAMAAAMAASLCESVRYLDQSNGGNTYLFLVFYNFP